MRDLKSTQRKRAEGIANGDFIGILTYSGRGLLGRDPKGSQHLLPSDASNDALGTAIRDALQRSRFLSPLEYESFFDPQKGKEKHDQWVKMLMTRYAYKTKKALFKHMKSCEIISRDQSIVFRPTHHDKLEGWADIGDESAIAVSAVTSDEALGQALREAFARCT
jgi:hypothetical protein